MENDIEKILYRILLGYYYIVISNITYKIIYPSLDVKYKAQLLYEQTIEENKYDKAWLTPEEISLYLQHNNIWNNSKQNELEKNNKTLEDLKIDLYLNYINDKKKKSIKNSIKNLNIAINNQYAQKMSMNHLGIEEQALSIKNEFIIMHTIYYNDQLYFDNPDSELNDSLYLQKFIHEIVVNTIDAAKLRTVVRSDLWRSYATCSNLNMNFLDINDDYRHLIGLHKMYDNARQHPEAPSEDIIKDDDALDGWFLYQNRKAEKEKKKNTILDKLGDKNKNKDEIFLITNDLKEAQEIFDINDDKGKQQIQEIISTSKQKDTKWSDLNFVQQDIKKEINSRRK